MQNIPTRPGPCPQADVERTASWSAFDYYKRGETKFKRVFPRPVNSETACPGCPGGDLTISGFIHI